MKVKVKHLIAYLNTLDQETPVFLDKDGWGDEYPDDPNDPDYIGEPTEDGTELSVINGRGLFRLYKDTLIIQN